MSKLILKTPELQVIEKSKADQIKKTFDPMVKMLGEFEGKYNEILKEAEKEVTHEVTTKAKRIRIDIGRVRIETEKLRKSQKEEYLRAGKAIDGVANILKWAVTDKENKLKEIENHFELQEEKRLKELQNKRVGLLCKYVDDADERDLASMDDDVWDAYFNAKKQSYNDRIEAEKKAEKDRIAREKAEKAEQERIRKENELLKKEREKREKQLKAEAEKRAKDEAERKAKEEKERKIREEKERKERESYELKLKKEREEKDRIETILKEKQEAEKKAKREDEERKQNELQKGDADKMRDLVSDLSLLKTKYAFKSKKNIELYNATILLIDKIINFLIK